MIGPQYSKSQKVGSANNPIRPYFRLKSMPLWYSRDSRSPRYQRPRCLRRESSRSGTSVQATGWGRNAIRLSRILSRTNRWSRTMISMSSHTVAARPPMYSSTIRWVT